MGQKANAPAIQLLRRIPLLFHFTDRRNLDLIRELGGLYPLAALNRMKVKVPAPGGNVSPITEKRVNLDARLLDRG